MSDDNKIVESAKRIKKKFRSEVVVEKDADEMSFLDELDSHVKDILGDDASDIYTVLDKEKLEKWKQRSLRRKLSRLSKAIFSKETFYKLLLAVITFFLMTEALEFYAVDGTITSRVYLKAILTEVAFIFLSGYRAVGKIQSMFVGFMRVSLFSLMLFVISSTVLFSGANTRSEIANLSSQIQVVENQIAEKQKEIDYYVSIKWPRNATQSRIAKEELVDKLLTLKEKQIAEKKNEGVSDLVLYQTYGRAFFRVILLFISVLLTRRLFKF